MRAPQKVVIEFVRRWHFEAGDSDTLRIDAAKHLADRAVLAARIHRLKHDQDLVLVFGIKQFLQVTQSRFESCQFSCALCLFP